MDREHETIPGIAVAPSHIEIARTNNQIQPLKSAAADFNLGLTGSRRTRMTMANAVLPQASMDLKSMARHAARLPGLSARGSHLLAAGKLEEANLLYEQMLCAEPESREAHAGLYHAYSALGDKHRAASHLGMAMQWPAVLTLPYRGTGEPVPVLLLLSMNAGNSLLQRFLNDRVFQTYVVLMEFFQEKTILPHHRLIVNAVGDADVRSEALAAERVIARSGAPVINLPARVMATGRCGNAQRLGRIPGVIRSAQRRVFP